MLLIDSPFSIKFNLIEVGNTDKRKTRKNTKLGKKNKSRKSTRGEGQRGKKLIRSISGRLAIHLPKCLNDTFCGERTLKMNAHLTIYDENMSENVLTNNSHNIYNENEIEELND